MEKNWQVIYYISPSNQIPVKDFLDSCSPSIKAKAFRILLNLEEYGLQAIIPHIKKLTGTTLWEIRLLGKKSARILYATLVGKKVLLLHAFYKKKQKTPKKEIKIALNRLYESLT